MNSPTGRAPRFLWSADWQARYARAAAENHPWWRTIRTNADLRIANKPRYADYGQWNALVYQITGDLAHGQAGVAAVLPTVAPLNTNHVREHYIEAVILYDWLLPAMTPEQKADYEARLHVLARYALGIDLPKYVGGFNLADSDQTVGMYLGLALTDLALGTDYLTQTTQAAHVPKVPVGGLTATGSEISVVFHAAD